MYSSLTTARWYTTAKNSQLCNSLAQQTKAISLPNTRRPYRGNLSAALITTILLFMIKLPSYRQRYSR